MNDLGKKFKIFKGSGITLINNEIKDIKVIRSLENREILSIPFHSLTNFEINIIITNLNLTAFIQEIIYLTK